MDKVLALAARTGDKVIVLSETNEPFVVMTVKEYESLLHGATDINKLTEDELLDKINRDIAVWKASQEETASDYDLDQFKIDALKKPEIQAEPKIEAIKAEEDDKFYIEPVD